MLSSTNWDVQVISGARIDGNRLMSGRCSERVFVDYPSFLKDPTSSMRSTPLLTRDPGRLSATGRVAGGEARASPTTIP